MDKIDRFTEPLPISGGAWQMHEAGSSAMAYGKIHHFAG